jgi:hypothetical protein
MFGKVSTDFSIAIGDDNDHLRFMLRMIPDALGTQNHVQLKAG